VIERFLSLTPAVRYGIIALLLGIVMLTLKSPSEPEVMPPQRAALSVEIIQPVQETLAVTLSANGSIAAWQEAVISAEIAGIPLTEIQAQVGDRVKKGQVLAVFDRERVASDLENSEALLAEAVATLAEAHENAQRVREIIDEGALSALQAGQYLTAEKTADARMRAARAQVEIQRLRMRHTQVIANDEGQIIRRTATLGSVTREGEELFRMIRQNRLEWRAEVTATELPKIRAGLPVHLRVPDVGTLEGVVRRVGPGLDENSRFGLVYVDLPGAEHQGFRPGMYAHGDFEIGSTEALTVPRTAITLRDGFSYAFRVVDIEAGRGRVEEIKLSLGRSAGDAMEVLEGVAVTDTLVRSGGAFLADGDRVRVVP
jgi:RND family efflux transporter MFP subunit